MLVGGGGYNVYGREVGNAKQFHSLPETTQKLVTSRMLSRRFLEVQ